MPHLMTLLNTCIVNSSVLGDQWRRSHSRAIAFGQWGRHHPTSGGRHFEDRRTTVHQQVQYVKINVGSGKIIYDDLHMWKVLYLHRGFPGCSLQKQERVKCSQAPVNMCQGNKEDFFNRLVAQDETWVDHYDPETKAQSKQWKHFLPPKNPTLGRQGYAYGLLVA